MADSVHGTPGHATAGRYLPYGPPASQTSPSENPKDPLVRPNDVVIGHELPVIALSSHTRTRRPSGAMSDGAPTPLDKEQMQGLKNIREFLKLRTSYDVLPLSFRLIVLDADVLIQKSLSILVQNGIVSAPIWDSHNSTFAGLLTSTDYMNVIQYCCMFDYRDKEVDKFRLSRLREIEKEIGVVSLETLSIHPMRPLYEACRRMLRTRARRIPLVDKDAETGREMVVSVITQYRILKFIAVNNEHNTGLLKKPVREIGLGTYDHLVTASMDASVLEVIGLMVKHNISAVPIIDQANRVLNVFEAVDVISCINGPFDELKVQLRESVGDALAKRSPDFAGIYTCNEADRLDSIFETLRKSRVHRLVVMDDETRLKGIISLSDILTYVLLDGEASDGGEELR